MKKIVLFLAVMGCIVSVGAYNPWDSYQYNRYNQYQYDRYGQFPSFWGQSRYSQQADSFPRYGMQQGYFSPYSAYSGYPSYASSYAQPYSYQPSYSRPFPILATGNVIQPDPGDAFPWAYYPDSYAQQYYDLDNGEVILKGNSVLPSTIRINVGDTVTWKSKEGYPHIIKSAHGSGESFDSGSLIFGESFSKQFNQEGTYDYYDPLYPWLRGRIVVSS
ncbi:MAG: hypothetical protein AABX70_04360 [Nanoarchaeota archaeon]|mgnify:CR=1 FL=1